MLTRRYLLATLPLAAQEWPQWRGPNRDGIAPASQAPASWPDRLKQVWRVPVGEGHSSPVVAGGRVFQFARRGEDEVLYALDFATGKELFRRSWRAPYEMNPAATSHGKGPKSTPAVWQGHVYTLGMSGILNCVTTAGEQVWRYDSAGKWRAASPLYGVAMSPVVWQGRLIAHVGTDANGALTAFDAKSGKLVWQLGQGPGYGSPVLAGAVGDPEVVTFSSSKFMGVKAATGALLWETPFTTPYDQNAVTPLVVGDLIVYSGLSHPVTAIRTGTGAPQRVWENKEVSLYMSSPVLAGGLIHGLSHRNKGQFFSLDPKTGRTVWTSDGRQAENAMLTSRGDTVFALTTESELHVMRASEKGLQTIRKYTVADTPVWAHPVIAGNRILVKDKDSLALWTV